MKRLIGTLLMTIVATAQGATVRLQENAIVSAARVTVGDIAVVEANGPAERARLCAVVVDYLPAGCQTRLVPAATVSEALRGAGENLGAINLAGYSRVTVKRNIAGSPAKISLAARRFLETVSPDARHTISGLKLDFTPTASFKPLITACRPKHADGPVRFDVADAADPSHKVGHAYATVTKTVPALVAARTLRAGKKITPDDILETYVPVGTADACGDASELVGRTLARGVKAGTVLSDGCITGTKVIKRGDEICLTVCKGAMTVSMKTLALEDGATGDVVRLKRSRGRGDYVAKVTGPGRATLFEGVVQ